MQIDALLPVTLASAALAQCPPQVLSPFGGTINAPVRTLTQWDPDGSGPLLPRLVAGGEFVVNGGFGGDFVSYWDGSNWRGLGWGADGPVNALCTWDPDGAGPLPPQLIAAGEFVTVGSDSTGAITATHIARWDGTAWRRLGIDLDDSVYALTTWDPDGAGPQPALLVAGGAFRIAGGTLTDFVATWDGTSWRALGWGLDGAVHALTTWSPNGSTAAPLLIAGGDFVNAGAGGTGQVAARGVASWDGAAWHGLGSGVAGVRSFAVFDLDAQGPLEPRLIAANNHVQAWDGAVWYRIDGEATEPHEYGDPIYHCRSSYTLYNVTTLGVWDPDGANPIPPQLFAGGVYHSSGVSCGKACDGCHSYSYLSDKVMYWTAPGWNGYDAPSAGALTTFDSDGAGPNSPLLVGAGGRSGTASFIAASTFLQPAIVLQPEAVMIRPGQTATLSVNAANGPLTFQWARGTLQCSPPGQNCYYTYSPLADGVTPNGSVIAGAATAQLHIANIALSDAGLYACNISNGCGTVSTGGVMVTVVACSADFDGDSDVGTDQDIEAFFRCLAGTCCVRCTQGADYNGDGDVGTDADIESFFRVLAGGTC